MIGAAFGVNATPVARDFFTFGSVKFTAPHSFADLKRSTNGHTTATDITRSRARFDSD